MNRMALHWRRRGTIDVYNFLRAEPFHWLFTKLEDVERVTKHSLLILTTKEIYPLEHDHRRRHLSPLLILTIQTQHLHISRPKSLINDRATSMMTPLPRPCKFECVQIDRFTL
jgi:hypothetical protein